MLKHIPMMLWMAWTTLKRDKVALLLTFALPIAFFSIFVMIFGGSVLGGGGMSKVRVALVDLDDTDNSRRFVQALSNEGGLRVITQTAGEQPRALTRDDAVALVREGEVGVGVIVPKGFGETFPNFSFGADAGDGAGDDAAASIEILADSQRDPIAPQVVAGLMQKAAMMGAPDLMIESGLGQFEKFAGGLTPQQRTAMDTWLPQLREQMDQRNAATTAPDGASGGGSDASAFSGLVSVKVVNVQGDHRSDWEAFIAFQVAQTAVMFLLFSMAGAAGSMLDEQENGTLERLLSSNIGMGGLLAGKWLVIALLGVAQLAVMFLWAWKPFGLTLFTPHHLAGWAIMSLATASAGAGFGMVLATACRSRGQLSGISTIVILIMSAVGGSMFPRFMMSESLQKVGLLTFNAWALDGYRKVFYDNAPLWHLWPQVSVLIGLTIVFMIIARMLARRWETA